MGLFVAALALSSPRSVPSKESGGAKSEPTDAGSRVDLAQTHPLEMLYRHLKESDWVKSRIDGVSLKRFPHRIVIAFESDELYEGDDGVAITEPWLNAIDRIAGTLIPSITPSLLVRVEGFKEGRDVNSGVSTFKQSADFRLATERATWFIDHLESLYPALRRNPIHLGAGVAESAERVEIQIELR
jgi:hypothetical protein